MFGWLKRKLGRSGSQGRSEDRGRTALLQQIERLRHSADPADVATRGRLWNQLGTLAHEEGDPRAPAHFGAAIDAYLEAGYFDAAASMCRRLIRLHPEVVRARCTLAFLSIGQRHLGDAAQEIMEYTLASKRTGTERYAISRLRLMAEATSDAVVLRRIASALGELGDEEGRALAQGLLSRPRNDDPADQGKHWERLLAVALLSREQLRGHAAPQQAPAGGDQPADGSVWQAA